MKFMINSEILPSRIDTQYSILDEIQKSLKEIKYFEKQSIKNLSQKDKILLRRREKNSDLINLHKAVVFRELNIIYFKDKSFRADIYKQKLETELFFNGPKPLDSGYKYKKYEEPSTLEKYQNNDYKTSEREKSVESVLLELYDMALSSGIPPLQKVIDHSQKGETQKDKRIIFNGTLKNNLVRSIADWSQKKEIAKLELLHSSFRKRLIDTIELQKWIQKNDDEYYVNSKSTKLYQDSKSRAELSQKDKQTLNKLILKMKKFNNLISGLDSGTLDQNQELEDNTTIRKNSPQIFRTKDLENEILPFLFKEQKLKVSKQMLFDIFSEYLEGYILGVRSFVIDFKAGDEGEEVDNYFTDQVAFKQNYNDPAQSINRSLVVDELNKLSKEEKLFLLSHLAFIHIFNRFESEQVRLKSEIDAKNLKNFVFQIADKSNIYNFSPIKLNMRKNALEEILNKELFIEYFQQDNINEENLKKTFSLINKISKQFENEKGAEEEIFDIFIQEFYELLDIEIKNRNE
tara:strand:- start:12510 stop:14063 length:1554 start_codon:yes stop_codon:yes gene_type:complete